MASMRSSALRPTAPSRTFEDVDELTDHLAGWDLDCTQLAPGPVVGSHGIAHVGSMLLQGGRTLVPLVQRGAAPPLATFSVLAAPSIRVISRGREHTGADILVSRPGEETHWRSGPDFHVRTLSVDEGLLRSEARELGLERGIDLAMRAHSVRPAPDSLARLQRAVFDVSTNQVVAADEAPSPRAGIERGTLRLLARALASHEGSAEPERLRRLDQVMLDVQAVLQQHPDRAFTREELSYAVGVSDRSIRRATQAWYGTSPLHLMKVRRLHAARRDLRRANPRSCRVIDVATRWGFTHMSRFAEEYGHLFGERPSGTLRRDTS